MRLDKALMEKNFQNCISSEQFRKFQNQNKIKNRRRKKILRHNYSVLIVKFHFYYLYD